MENHKNTTLVTSQPDDTGDKQIKPQLASSPKREELKKERKQQPLREKTTAALNSSPLLQLVVASKLTMPNLTTKKRFYQ